MRALTLSTEGGQPPGKTGKRRIKHPFRAMPAQVKMRCLLLSLHASNSDRIVLKLSENCGLSGTKSRARSRPWIRLSTIAYSGSRPGATVGLLVTQPIVESEGAGPERVSKYAAYGGAHAFRFETTTAHAFAR